MTSRSPVANALSLSLCRIFSSWYAIQDKSNGSPIFVLYIFLHFFLSQNERIPLSLLFKQRNFCKDKSYFASKKKKIIFFGYVKAFKVQIIFTKMMMMMMIVVVVPFKKIYYMQYVPHTSSSTNKKINDLNNSNFTTNKIRARNFILTSFQQ